MAKENDPDIIIGRDDAEVEPGDRPADIKERAFWNDYQAAFEDALTNCSTEHAPWYVVPANKKWYRNLVIARTIADTLAALDPHFPPAEEGLENVKIPD